MAETKFCRYCGAIIYKEAKTCNFCGKNVYKDPDEEKLQELHCVTCGAIVFDDDIFCPVCGGAFSELSRSTASVDVNYEPDKKNNIIGIHYNIGILIKALIIAGVFLMYLCTTNDASIGKNLLYFSGIFVAAEILLYIYFVPTIIAIENNNRNMCLIYIINLLLGITLIGWVVALIMALSNNNNQA